MEFKMLLLLIYCLLWIDVVFMGLLLFYTIFSRHSTI
jgi:hypothetical protein